MRCLNNNNPRDLNLKFQTNRSKPFGCSKQCSSAELGCSKQFSSAELGNSQTYERIVYTFIDDSHDCQVTREYRYSHIAHRNMIAFLVLETNSWLAIKGGAVTSKGPTRTHSKAIEYSILDKSRSFQINITT